MDIFKSFPVSLRMILKDPINLVLALIPTFLALAIYILLALAIFQNSDYLGLLIRDYFPGSSYSGVIGSILAFVFIAFVILLMNWTFVIVVGLLAAPFNSMLSSRIEKKLAGKTALEDKNQTIKTIFSGLKQTFVNEFKKIVVIILMSLVALLFNLLPLLYPIGILLVSLLFAVQFIDYSWSRHNMVFSSCLADSVKNIFPYTLGGFFFLLLITVPIINAFVPAFATSYFTVLWLYRHKKIPL